VCRLYSQEEKSQIFLQQAQAPSHSSDDLTVSVSLDILGTEPELLFSHFYYPEQRFRFWVIFGTPRLYC
jgi:hypothetical protein